MIRIVTLNELLTIEDKLKSIVKEYEINNEYLDEAICNQYDIVELRTSLSKILTKFKSARYLYDFSVDDNINITSNYDFKIEQFQQSKKSVIENNVKYNVDNKILTTNIYDSLLVLCKNLTGDELNYLIQAFFHNKSEDDIAYLIGISRTTLQKPKKSAIVKAWTILKKYSESDC